MNRIFRTFPLLALVAVPALAIARPPLIYHHVTKLAAHPGHTVRLVLSQQDVVIHVAPDNSVTVSTDIWAHAGSAEAKVKIVTRLAPKISTQDGNVVILSPTHNSWGWPFNFSGSPQARVTVTMPVTMAVNYRLGSGDFRFVNPGAANLIKGDSGSGDVMVKSASTRLAAKTGSGDIFVALHQADPSAPVQLRTGSGDINFSGTVDSLNVSTGSGDIGISSASAKQALLSSGSGDITAHWQNLAAGASLKARSGSGDLVMFFPAGSKLGGTISTGSGEVNTDFAATIHSNRHSYTLA
ncbi:MAG TPA: hypothetical protein ENI75_03080, partial [Mizugakiibacter sp.]|nr:hypothetical protein [Mizugakiibacter sp.]